MGRDRSGFVSWLRGRPSTTTGASALWAKSLLNAALFFGVFVIALPWLAHVTLSGRLPIPSGAGTFAGGALFLLGIAGWIASIEAFVRVGRGTPLPADAPSRLVTTGLFGLVRNPMIASELMVVWGVALWFASLGTVLYAAGLSIVAHLVVVRVEEPVLRQRYGRAFDEYCRTVPRWVPSFRAGSASVRRPTRPPS